MAPCAGFAPSGVEGTCWVLSAVSPWLMEPRMPDFSLLLPPYPPHSHQSPVGAGGRGPLNRCGADSPGAGVLGVEGPGGLSAPPFQGTLSQLPHTLGVPQPSWQIHTKWAPTNWGFADRTRGHFDLYYL